MWRDPDTDPQWLGVTRFSGRWFSSKVPCWFILGESCVLAGPLNLLPTITCLLSARGYGRESNHGAKNRRMVAPTSMLLFPLNQRT